MVVRRSSRVSYLPHPFYEPGSKVMTVALVVKVNCGLDEIGQTIMKWDYVPYNEIQTLAHLNHFAELGKLTGNRKYYIRKNSGWELVSCDWHVFEWAQSHHYRNGVSFTVLLEGEVGEDEFEMNFGGCGGVISEVNLVDNDVRSTEIPQELYDVNLGVSESEDDEYTPYNVSEDNMCDGGDAFSLVNLGSDAKRLEVANGKRKVVESSYFGGVESESSDYPEQNFALDSDDDYDSELESDQEEIDMPKNRPKKKYVKRNEFYDPQLTIGVRFPNKTSFRNICKNHAIAHQRNITFERNDRHYIYAKCDVDTCPWFVNAQLIDSEKTWSIYKMEEEHSCGPCYNVHNVKSSWLAERYLGKFKIDPEKSIEAFRDDVLQDIGVRISKDQAYRAKRKANDMIIGDPDVQFEILWDYAEELKKTNEGSTVLVDYDKDTKKFTNFYAFFGALKQAFLNACRPILGLDRASLKGPHGGVLLTACVVDPNDKPLPLAWAVVNTEFGETWTWFLKCLKKDLQITKPEDYTFISDKQKGLIYAFKEVFPESRHKFCVMHLWKNMYKAGFRGDAYRNALFKASCATNMGKFNTAMKEMGELDDKVLGWLHDKHPTQWAKSHFSTLPKCDVTMNNGCENYNKVILLARQKPIVTMMEWIRQYNMGTMTKKRDRAKKWTGKWCPVVKKTLDRLTLRLKECIAEKSDDYHFQITLRNGDQYNVDLIRRECTCRRYDLTGMPCLHVVSACSYKNEDAYKYVHECYSVETYRKCYEGAIRGINGQELWSQTFFIPPLPPNFGRKGKKGKPERARRLGFDETKNKNKKGRPGAVKRQQTTLTCSYCSVQGHNLQTCKQKFLDLEEEALYLNDEEVDLENYRTDAQELVAEVEAFVIPSTEAEHASNLVDVPTQSVAASQVPSQGVSSNTVVKPTCIKRPKTLGLKRYSDKDKLVLGPTMEQQTRSCSMVPPPPNMVLSQRMNIRAPPPMSGNHFLNVVPRNLVSTQEPSAKVPTFVVDGKKYVTMTNLSPALLEIQKQKAKGKGKIQTSLPSKHSV